MWYVVPLLTTVGTRGTHSVPLTPPNVVTLSMTASNTPRHAVMVYHRRWTSSMNIYERSVGA